MLSLYCCCLVLASLVTFAAAQTRTIGVPIVSFNSVANFPLSNPWAIAVSNKTNRVYFSNIGAPAPYRDWVGATPLSSSTSAVEVVLDESNSPSGSPIMHVKSMVVDDSNQLWLAVYGGGGDVQPSYIWRCPIDDAAATSGNERLSCAVITTITRADVSLTSIAFMHGRVYYSVAAGDLSSSTIVSMNQQGQEELTLVESSSQGLAYPVSVAVDPLRKYVFWADDHGDNRIGRGTVGDDNRLTNVGAIVSDAGVRATNLIVDYLGERIYWTDRSAAAHSIQSATLDGGDISNDFALGTTLPNSMAIDFNNKRLLWTQPGTNEIRFVSADDLGVATEASAALVRGERTSAAAPSSAMSLTVLAVAAIVSLVSNGRLL